MLEKAKAVICKFQKNIARYYNKYYIFISTFNPSNKIYLNFIDIYTIYLLELETVNSIYLIILIILIN